MSSRHAVRPEYDRETEIRRLRAELELTSFPRLKMLLIVCLTGGAGFFATYQLLHYGVTAMIFRYPAAIAIAYLAFLLLLWIWLRTSAEDYSGELPDVSGIFPRHPPSSAVDFPSAAADGNGLSDLSGAGEAGELWVPILIVMIVGAVFVSALWIVYSAPALFAELIVDGVLSASLYRRLRGLETRHWLGTAIRRTLWPFVLSAIICGICGGILQSHFPQARTLGDAVHIYQERSARQPTKH